MLGKSEATGDTYGCPRCHIMFTVEIEPYEAVDESEVKAETAKLPSGESGHSLNKYKEGKGNETCKSTV